MEPRDSSDIDGQPDGSNGALGTSDIEGKTAREAASELGSERVSNERERMSQSLRSYLLFRISVCANGLTLITSSSRSALRAR